MNFLKRSIISIIRRPGKSAILLVLIFVLSNVIAGAVSVKAALANTEDAMLNQMDVEVSIEPDWDEIDKDPMGYDTMPSITADIVESIGKSEYIKYYDYSIIQYYEVQGLQNYYEGSIPGEEYNGWFGLTGGQSSVIMDMENGDLELKEGRIYTKEEIESGAKVVLISDKVAQLNGLNVGSKITFLYTIYDYDRVYGDPKFEIYDDYKRVDMGGDIGILPIEPWEPTIVKSFEFEFDVIGVFSAKPLKITDRDGNIQEQDSPLINSFYTVNRAISACNDDILEAMRNAGMENLEGSYTNATAVFILRHPDEVELFESANKQYLPKGLVFINNADSFESLRTPMANVEWIADIVMWVAIGATVLIISLLVTLFLRDRKHEMGIYLSLGERKSAIAAQILAEVLIVAVIAVSLSIFSGNILATNMSETMLENQLIEEEKNQNNDGGITRPLSIVYDEYGNTPELSTEDVMEMYDVSLDGKTIAFIYLIGMGSVIVSTLVPIVYTLRLKPKQILM